MIDAIATIKEYGDPKLDDITGIAVSALIVGQGLLESIEGAEKSPLGHEGQLYDFEGQLTPKSAPESASNRRRRCVNAGSGNGVPTTETRPGAGSAERETIKHSRDGHVARRDGET